MRFILETEQATQEHSMTDPWNKLQWIWMHTLGWLSFRKVQWPSASVYSLQALQSLAWYFNESMMSFIQSRFPLPATAKHPHNKAGPPPCLTKEMVFFCSLALPFFDTRHTADPFVKKVWSHNSIKHSSRTPKVQQINFSIFQLAFYVLLGQEWRLWKPCLFSVLLILCTEIFFLLSSVTLPVFGSKWRVFLSRSNPCDYTVLFFNTLESFLWYNTF